MRIVSESPHHTKQNMKTTQTPFAILLQRYEDVTAEFDAARAAIWTKAEQRTMLRIKECVALRDKYYADLKSLFYWNGWTETDFRSAKSSMSVTKASFESVDAGHKELCEQHASDLCAIRNWYLTEVPYDHCLKSRDCAARTQAFREDLAMFFESSGWTEEDYKASHSALRLLTTTSAEASASKLSFGHSDLLDVIDDAIIRRYEPPIFIFTTNRPEPEPTMFERVVEQVPLMKGWGWHSAAPSESDWVYLIDAECKCVGNARTVEGCRRLAAGQVSIRLPKLGRPYRWNAYSSCAVLLGEGLRALDFVNEHSEAYQVARRHEALDWQSRIL